MNFDTTKFDGLTQDQRMELLKQTSTSDLFKTYLELTDEITAVGGPTIDPLIDVMALICIQIIESRPTAELLNCVVPEHLLLKMLYPTVNIDLS